MNCSQCGFEQPVIQQYCSNCGYQLLFTQASETPPAAQPEDQRKTAQGILMVIGLTAIVIFGGVSVVLWFLSNSREKAAGLQPSAVGIATPTPSPTETPAQSDSPEIQNQTQQANSNLDADKDGAKTPRKSRRYSARSRAAGYAPSRVDKVPQSQQNAPVSTTPAPSTPTPAPRQDKKCLFGGTPIPCR